MPDTVRRTRPSAMTGEARRLGMRLRRQSWCPTALRKARRSCSHELTLLGSRQLTRSWPTVAHFRRRQRTRESPATVHSYYAFSDYAGRSPKLGVARSNRARVTIWFRALSGFAPASVAHRITEPNQTEPFPSTVSSAWFRSPYVAFYHF